MYVVVVLKPFILFFPRPQHAQEDFEEETMEDDEAELTLNKVEEEMMVSTVKLKTSILLTGCIHFIISSRPLD